MKKIVLVLLGMFVLVSAANAELKKYSESREKYTRITIQYDSDFEVGYDEFYGNYEEFVNADLSWYIERGKYYTGEIVDSSKVPSEILKCFLETSTSFVRTLTYYAGTQKSEDSWYMYEGMFLHYHCDYKNGRGLKKQTIEKADAVDSADGSRDGVSTASTRAADVKEDYIWE